MNLYYCVGCREWKVIMPKGTPENHYVYCRNCQRPSHAGDVIAASIDESHRIAGNAAAKQASMQSHRGIN